MDRGKSLFINMTKVTPGKKGRETMTLTSGTNSS